MQRMWRGWCALGLVQCGGGEEIRKRMRLFGHGASAWTVAKCDLGVWWGSSLNHHDVVIKSDWRDLQIDRKHLRLM